MSTELCFVYGTLMQTTSFWAGEAATEVIADCFVQGRIYDHGFPVAKLGEQGRIRGELHLYQTDHPDYRHMVRVERGAGYSPVSVLVEKPDGTEVEAIAWHYDHRPQGALIEDGDFAAHVERRAAARASQTADSIRTEVFESLDNALTNGYDMRRMAPVAVAFDLLEANALFEGMRPKVLIPHVEAWQEARR